MSNLTIYLLYFCLLNSLLDCIPDKIIGKGTFYISKDDISSRIENLGEFQCFNRSQQPNGEERDRIFTS